jgi:hypothetical protein
MTCVFYGLLVQSMRHLRVWRRRANRTGAALARAVPLACVLMLPFAVFAQPGPRASYAVEDQGREKLLLIPRGDRTLQVVLAPNWPPAWCCGSHGNVMRGLSQAFLNGCEGKHLVFVKYKEGHQAENEWVFNDADLDNAKVVWARDIDEASNQALLRYFKDRRPWFIQVP